MIYSLTVVTDTVGGWCQAWDILLSSSRHTNTALLVLSCLIIETFSFSTQ